jgi:ABC-type sugar transport system substrate-binding protein
VARLIEDGRMAGTIQRSPYDMGRTAIDAAIGILKGTQVPQEILLGDMTLVTADNVGHEAIKALHITANLIDDLMQSSATLLSGS